MSRGLPLFCDRIDVRISTFPVENDTVAQNGSQFLEGKCDAACAALIDFKEWWWGDVRAEARTLQRNEKQPQILRFPSLRYGHSATVCFVKVVFHRG
jgi:hypothetical protein